MEAGRFAPYCRAVLKAGVFDDFKGATTLLLWGDREGMASLLTGFSALRDGSRDEFAIDGPQGDLIVRSTLAQGSALRAEANRLNWSCSPETVELAADLVEPLLHGPGHQFLDVSGLAEQVIISRDEYPDGLR